MSGSDRTSPQHPVPVDSLLAAIVDSSDDAIISKDLRGVITSWNKAAERIFGYSAAEAIGQSITLIIPPERTNEEAHILSRVRRGERVDHYVTVRRCKDGQEVEVSVTISPVKDSAGVIIGASKIVRDVTKERRAVHQLRVAEERFRTTLGSIGDAVIATDIDSGIAFMNKVAEDLTGWPESDARGKPLSQVFNIINEFSRKPVLDPAAKVLRDGVTVGLANHTLLIARDGAERPIADSAAPIRDALGRLSGVVLVFRDVSAARAAEIGAARLAAIVSSSDDAIVGKDLNGIINSWNKGAERIFGYTASEVIGKSITMLMPPERRGEEQHILARLRRRETVDHFETVRQTKDGRLIDVSVTISPIVDGAGEIVGASKVARDITPQKRAQRALEAAQAQLQAHARELEDKVQQRTAQLRETIAELESFSYTVSHDLRAPLRGMQQFAQILLAEHAASLNPEGQNLLQRIVSSSQRMDVLIRDVLTYSRVMRSPIEMETVNLEALVADLLQHYPVLQPPAARINVRSPLLSVRGNQALLTQSISNLLTNAVKFVAPGVTPSIEIRTETLPRPSQAGDAPTVRLCIQGNGIGIPPEHHNQIFGIFQRLHSAHEFEGTGIGLAIVRKAVERMGGAICVESQLGQGSKFCIDLPGVSE